MKKTIILFALIAFISATSSATSSIFIKPPKNPVKASEVYLPVGKAGELISLMDLSRISVKDYETLTGKKMKFINKMNFKIGQRQLKKSINPDGTFSKKKMEKFFTKAAEDGGGFSLVGLALGLLLSLVGVLIAYLISGENKKSTVTWAWIGAAISLVLWGALII
ncbi:MAG TPA: hypothetical protein VFH08_07470 [Chitinophagaceae bacterium]|nr:hypothetical protein [Chitinophagaceae bacterium]